jgi:hypothetical protein
VLAGVVHKDSAHHLCCCVDEVVAIVPFHLLLVYQAKRKPCLEANRWAQRGGDETHLRASEKKAFSQTVNY